MSKSVKVLYFVDRMLRGGIQSLVIDWVSRLDRKKIQVDFLLLDDGNKYELEDTLKKLGCNVYKLNNIWINNPIDVYNEAKALDSFFQKHHEYKVVHMHSSSKNYLVLKYAKKYGIPIRIAHSHNIDFQTNNIVKKFFGDFFKFFLKKYATDYFACSMKAGKWLFGKKSVDSGRVTIIHNAIDYKKFEYDCIIRNEVRKEYCVDDDELLIGNVGRFTNQKNHDFLIEIFYEITKLNSKSKLILVGTGEKEEFIRSKVKELGLSDKVIFAGFRKDVNRIMQAMDVFLLPSLYEGLPVVGIEAQAAGLPCFFSKDVITNEVKITDNAYFISLEESAKFWANTILNSDLKKCDNEENLKNAGYCIEDVINILQNFYQKY